MKTIYEIYDDIQVGDIFIWGIYGEITNHYMIILSVSRGYVLYYNKMYNNKCFINEKSHAEAWHKQGIRNGCWFKLC